MRTTASVTMTLGLLAALAPSSPADAAELPAHEPLGVLIVSDRVNPHGLPPELLTEPGDLSEAIAADDSGIDVSFVTEVDSDCIDEALGLLESEAVDVLIYFAHRSARACDGSNRQAQLTAATEGLLKDGGGVVVFHHGLYLDEGKDEILELLGGVADDLAWEPEAGQTVIATAPDHFITTHALTYETELDFQAFELGVAADRYPAFSNVPDERYPGVRHLEKPGETRTILFASDFAGPQILSYDLHRPEWIGRVVFYQPGEYKPNALDDRDGSNFQILANAIFHVATARFEPLPEEEEPEPEPDDTDGSSTGEPHVDATGDAATSGPTAAAAPGGARGCAVGSPAWPSILLLAAAVRRRERRT